VELQRHPLRTFTRSARSLLSICRSAGTKSAPAGTVYAGLILLKERQFSFRADSYGRPVDPASTEGNDVSSNCRGVIARRLAQR
jgi:hypothetical protein